MLNYTFFSTLCTYTETLSPPTLDTLSMSSAKNGTDQALQQFGDESQVPQLIGAYIACLIIAYTGVALRFLCRRMKQTPLGTDDWLILASLVSSGSINKQYAMILWLSLTSASSSQQHMRALI